MRVFVAIRGDGREGAEYGRGAAAAEAGMQLRDTASHGRDSGRVSAWSVIPGGRSPG